MPSDNRRVIFLDRDGVINVDHGYVSEWEKFEFIEGVIPALKALISLGFIIVIITNQSGIARGYYSEGQFLLLMEKLSEYLLNQGVFITKYYYCPHHIGGSIPALAVSCTCRKPKPGMIEMAVSDLNLSLEGSVLVGDKVSDIKAGLDAGVSRMFLVGQASSNSDLIYKRVELAKDLSGVVDKLRNGN